MRAKPGYISCQGEGEVAALRSGGFPPVARTVGPGCDVRLVLVAQLHGDGSLLRSAMGQNTKKIIKKNNGIMGNFTKTGRKKIYLQIAIM